MVENGDYATLRAYLGHWNQTTEEMIELPTRPCTSEEIGINQDQSEGGSLFYPFPEKFRYDLETYGHRLKCIDKAAINKTQEETIRILKER